MSRLELPSFWKVLLVFTTLYIGAGVILLPYADDIERGLEIAEPHWNIMRIAFIVLVFSFGLLFRIIAKRQVKNLDTKTIMKLEVYVGGMVKGTVKNQDSVKFVEKWCQKNLDIKDLIKRIETQEVEFDEGEAHYSLLITNLHFFDKQNKLALKHIYGSDISLKLTLEQLKDLPITWHCMHINRA